MRIGEYQKTEYAQNDPLAIKRGNASRLIDCRILQEKELLEGWSRL
jgi:hypothetical protein